MNTEKKMKTGKPDTKPTGNMEMTDEQKIAYEWALNQQFNSVAARYARTLAFYIKDTSLENARLREEQMSAKGTIAGLHLRIIALYNDLKAGGNYSGNFRDKWLKEFKPYIETLKEPSHD